MHAFTAYKLMHWLSGDTSMALASGEGNSFQIVSGAPRDSALQHLWPPDSHAHIAGTGIV